ncbi:DNA-binding transcriptional regulator, Lrp family [Halorientalis regularis]|jgi:DNA-binding Lrp family transcriptional regulator|uniref:DNA-binding transcriptional regulator, Lrp family n=2 Tax=Halorientalis regularis TaxID=660518 RepID=A0A1G7NB28_9EURY|nr:DNA-binding transcriptional regulator, Lrp family [Halorientalis regularis]
MGFTEKTMVVDSTCLGMSLEPDADEVDRIILKALANGPRTPYSDIAERLASEGHEMSSEGVRHRVSKLLDRTSIFFLLEPEEHEWEIVRLAITVTDDADAKSTALDRISEMPFWLVTRGVGTYDIYAVATAATNSRVDELVSQVRELGVVADVEQSIETSRDTNVDDYLSAGQRQ